MFGGLGAFFLYRLISMVLDGKSFEIQFHILFWGKVYHALFTIMIN